jgi:hypothetical protein
MKRNTIIFLISFLGLLIGSDAWPEYCWMVGCAGNVGFIRIPAGQIDKAKSKSIVVKNKKYTIDAENLLFKTPGIPKINSIVSLNQQTCIASKWNNDVRDIDEKVLNEFIKYFDMESQDYILDNGKMIAKIKVYDDYGGIMGRGSKIKILKYIKHKVKDGDAMFAFIQVVSDENK